MMKAQSTQNNETKTQCHSSGGRVEETYLYISFCVLMETFSYLKLTGYNNAGLHTT